MSEEFVRHSKSQKWPRGKDGTWVAVFTGACIMLLLLIAIEATARLELSRQSSDHLALIATSSIGLVTALIASFALAEQRKAREASTDPVLIVHLDQREDAKELITLKVSNVGAGAALDVNLIVHYPMGDQKHINRAGLIAKCFRKHHPFTVILQNNCVEFNLGIAHKLLGESPLPPFRAEIDYKDLDGGEYKGAFLLDVEEVRLMGVHKSPQMRTTIALEKIAESARKL